MAVPYGAVERRLAAIMMTDIVGYSRLMGLDDVATLQALHDLRRSVIDPAVARHH
jgi:adenylate cyclase